MQARLSSFLAAGLLAASIALPASAALNTGDAAPDFKTQASLAGKAFDYSLKDALKKGPVVVYFFPAAFTGACNLQAHTFAENYDKFTAAGASIIGVSLDKIGRLNEFSADPQYCAGKIAVASDADGKIAKSYQLAVKQMKSGAKDVQGLEIDHAAAERTTFVLTGDGKVAATVGGVAPDVNVQKTLEVVQKLTSEKKM